MYSSWIRIQIQIGFITLETDPTEYTESAKFVFISSRNTKLDFALNIFEQKRLNIYEKEQFLFIIYDLFLTNTIILTSRLNNVLNST